MTERARSGSYSALLALGAMANPQATKVLVELLENADPKFVTQVYDALYLRLPDPVLDDKLNHREFFENEQIARRTYLRDKSWRAEFAPPVRKYARKCLALRDEANLIRGALLLSCVGTAEDLPDLVAAFDFAVKEAQGKPLLTRGYPCTPADCKKLHRAVQTFVDRGVAKRLNCLSA